MTRVTSTVDRWWWRRFHPLVRTGWNSLTGDGDAVVGAGLMVVGYLLQKRRKRGREILYRATMRPGESMRIRISRGHRVVAERAIEG